MKARIFDSKGVELKVGDLVMIQQERNGNLAFFATVQVLNGRLFPMCNFSYDRIIKVEKLPEGIKRVERDVVRGFPNYWMHPNVELRMIESEELDKWRMDALHIERSRFITFESE